MVGIATPTQQAEALGIGMVPYSAATNPDNVGDVGFTTAQDCVDACKFCCDPGDCNPLGATCKLVWNDTVMGCLNSVATCQLLQQYPSGGGDCCFDEWYCEEIFGCTGYNFGSGLSPHPDARGPYTEYTACTEFCGYVCGDNWGDTCFCSWRTNDSSVGPYFTGNDIQLIVNGVVQPGVYSDQQTCTLNTGNAIGGVGCCDCYDCYIQGQVFSFMYLGFYINSPAVTVLQVTEEVEGTWASNTSYLEGETIQYLGCCYVFFGDGTSSSFGGPVDPYTWWTTLLADKLAGQAPTSTAWTPVAGTFAIPSIWVPCDCSCLPANGCP